MHSDQMCGKTKNIEGLDDVFDVFCLTKHPILALNFWSVIVLFSERVETWRYQGGNDLIDWRNGDYVDDGILNASRLELLLIIQQLVNLQ